MQSKVILEFVDFEEKNLALANINFRKGNQFSGLEGQVYGTVSQLFIPSAFAQSLPRADFRHISFIIKS